VIEDAIDRRLLDLLGQSSNRQLLMLHAAIDRMLADPRRIIEIRRHLHLGKTVQFLDWQHGVMLKGQVIALHERQVELREISARRQWKLPYTAVELPDGTGTRRAEPLQPPAPATPTHPTRNDFQRGDKVAFEDKYLQTVVGTIVRINQRTATIDPGDSTTWRVGFALLRPVVDV
jgi:hypothetical protein